MPLSRWYPTREQLAPENLERTLRQVLKQHYDLQDRYDALAAKVNAPATAAPKGPPPGCGPTDTQLLGLRVAPVDTTTLADGVKLTWVKAQGQFVFK